MRGLEGTLTKRRAKNTVWQHFVRIDGRRFAYVADCELNGSRDEAFNCCGTGRAFADNPQLRLCRRKMGQGIANALKMLENWLALSGTVWSPTAPRTGYNYTVRESQRLDVAVIFEPSRFLSVAQQVNTGDMMVVADFPAYMSDGLEPEHGAT